METITIVANEHGFMVVYDGAVKGSTLWFCAPGLLIHKKGPLGRNYDRFCNLACNEAIARHIPAISLRRVAK